MRRLGPSHSRSFLLYQLPRAEPEALGGQPPYRFLGPEASSVYRPTNTLSSWRPLFVMVRCTATKLAKRENDQSYVSWCTAKPSGRWSSRPVTAALAGKSL